ncbi:MAG: hypothetical protein L3K17_09360 [Thermoplasmata archaeon]|nr:hypothetical protein [Thermoplasmata archaeon]
MLAVIGLIAVAGSWELYIQLSRPSGGCGAPPGGNTPLGGSSFAIGSATPAGGPGNHSYTMAVNPSDRDQWVYLAFQVVDSRGSNLTPGSGWSVVAFGVSGQLIANYSFQTQTWSSGATVLMTSGESMSLRLGSSDLHGLGDKLVVEISNPNPCTFSGGSVSAPLP